MNQGLANLMVKSEKLYWFLSTRSYYVRVAEPQYDLHFLTSGKFLTK